MHDTPTHSDPIRITLDLQRDLEGHATLSLFRADAGPVEVTLDGRLARVLLVLHAFWLEDAPCDDPEASRVPASRRGLRAHSEIAEAISKLLPHRDPIGHGQTVVRYVFEIRQAVARAVARATPPMGPAPRLIVTHRSVGYRLRGAGIEVVLR